MAKIPPNHPRYRSLLVREKLVEGFREGLVVPEGLLAHGRGEAFDYVMGERTHPAASDAAKVAAAHLILAKRPVISVNGNTAVLSGEEVVELSRAVPARIEVNLFHRTEERVRRIMGHLEQLGAEDVLGMEANARIPGLESERGVCSREGIFSTDVVLVPLEDGDRTEKLVSMGKSVLAIDLNPLSRTSKMATVTIVDDVSRALRNMSAALGPLRHNTDAANNLVKSFSNRENLAKMILEIRAYLGSRA